MQKNDRTKEQLSPFERYQIKIKLISKTSIANSEVLNVKETAKCYYPETKVKYTKYSKH